MRKPTPPWATRIGGSDGRRPERSAHEWSEEDKVGSSVVGAEPHGVERRPPLVLQSRTGFAVQLGDTLKIPVDDKTFMGNCASGSFLSQSQADFITQRIFPSIFVSFRYDAATCTTILIGDAGAP